MIICHNDADGFSSAGILLLAQKDKLEDLQYATVVYINTLLKKLLKKDHTQKIYLLDINADDLDTFIQSLIKLQKKGNDITLLDHHPIPEAYDEELRAAGIKVIRDINGSCSELLFHCFIDEIHDKRKAQFLLCIGAIADRLVTSFVQTVIDSFRREEIFDVYACLLAGIPDAKAFLYSVFEEKDKDGVGFTKKLYYQATKKRFWMEKLKAKINLTKESSDQISVIHIFQRHIGFAAGYLIDQDNIKYSIAVGDGPPDFRNWFFMYLRKFLDFVFRRKAKKREGDKIRISFRSKVPINNLISSLSKKYNGFGGGHKYACGCTVPKDQLIPFLKEIIAEFKK